MTVYLTDTNNYYIASSPTAPDDCIIPFPSPQLLAILTAAAPNPVSADSVNTQLASVGNGDNSQFTDSGVSG